jgi:hypothetical protein
MIKLYKFKTKHIIDTRGIIEIIGKKIKFKINRVCYFNTIFFFVRGLHLQKKNECVLILVIGSLNAQLVFDNKTKLVKLNSKKFDALYIFNLVWRKLYNFLDKNLCIVLNSQRYNKDDYMFDLKKI